MDGKRSSSSRSNWQDKKLVSARTMEDHQLVSSNRRRWDRRATDADSSVSISSSDITSSLSQPTAARRIVMSPPTQARSRISRVSMPPGVCRNSSKGSSNLASFLSQLLQEKTCPSEEQQATFTTGDIANPSVALVSDNARAHSCHHLRLLRDRDVDNQAEMQLHHEHENKLKECVVVDVGDCTSSHYEEKKEEEDCDLAVVPLQREARQEESSHATTNNVRALQRPCRWSSDDSLSTSMLPNSPPTKTDYLPIQPRRKNSRDSFPDGLDEEISPSLTSSCQQRRRSPPTTTSGGNDSDTLENMVFDALALLETEELISTDTPSNQ